MEIKEELNLQEVDNIFECVRGLRISTDGDNYDIGCGLYHLSIRKVNHKLFYVFLEFEHRTIEKAIFNTVAETLKNFEELFVKLQELHKEHYEFPKATLQSLFDEFDIENPEYYLVSVQGVEKDLFFMLSPEDYEATQETLKYYKAEVAYKVSKVNLQGLQEYINYLGGHTAFVSFDVKLDRNRLSLTSPLSTFTFILPKDDLVNLASLLSSRGFLVSYED